ncbi:MAG: hypothetical protein H6985_04870 [Pseudomonadales bacterium]|nr:hypothetical protein [Pseudomonadales bacterium]
MKKILLILVLLIPFQAMAERDYTSGNYWTVTSVETKPGMYDDYISDLKRVWRKSVEMMKADGKLLSYRMFSNVYPRAGEPDLFLMIEWKSAGDALDMTDEEVEAQSKKLFGSLDKGTEAAIKREDLRTIKSQTLLRELSFN